MRYGIGVGLGLLALVVAGTAFGDDDPVHAREALMKMNNASARAAFAMIKGTTPYDPAAAAAQMNQISSDMDSFVTLFPAGSDTGNSEASPDIWTHMDDFKALATKLQTDAKAAAAAAPNGVDAFKAAFVTVNGDCTACHDKYRVED